MDEWVLEERPRRAAPAPADRRAATGHAARATRGAAGSPLPAELATEIRRLAEGATARRREMLVSRMEKAVQAFERNRFAESARVANELTRELPGVAAVRRLAGFSAYRLGRWRDAARHLEAYTNVSGEPDAVPALMDAQRALGRHHKVADAWSGLRRRSPDADILAEARIVASGSLADRGDLAGAIELLTSAGAARQLRNPSDRHVRQWYALGDLYERAGDVPTARDLFERVARVDHEAYDVAARLDALGDVRRHRRSRPGRRAGAGAPPARPGGPAGRGPK